MPNARCSMPNAEDGHALATADWLHRRARSRRVRARAAGTASAGGSIAGAAQRRRVRRAVPSGLELGPLGKRRSARFGEPGHGSQAQTGSGSREERHLGVARPQRHHREGRGQPEPVRAHDEPGLLHGHLQGVLSRLRAQPHRCALSHPLQRPDLQRLSARRGEHREGLHEARHRQPQERRRDPRHPHRHSATEERARISSRARRSTSRISRRGRRRPA